MNHTKRGRNSRRQHDAPTIADVAKMAGVSPMTVSRVINQDDRVRPQTKERVEKAIQTLNYFPNPSARRLAGAQPIRVGLVYDNPHATYLSEFLVGALEQSSLLDIQLTVEKCGELSAAINTLKDLVNRGIDGLLLPPPLSDSPEILDYLATTELPVVAAASYRLQKNVSAVSINDQQAAYEMTRHIITLGHTRIGFILGNPSQQASHERYNGYKQALIEHSIPIQQELITTGQFTYRSGLIAAQALLSLEKPPTAIFASNDDMAAATVAVAHRKHIEVPEQLTVCGFDDSVMARTIWPELTTIKQPILDMSRTAIKILVDKIRSQRNTQSCESTHRLLDFAFIKRESDGIAQQTNKTPSQKP